MIQIIIQTNPDKIQTLSLMNIMTIMYYMILNHQVGNSRLDDTPKQRTLTKLTMYIMYIYIYASKTKLMTHRPGKRDTCLSQQYS